MEDPWSIQSLFELQFFVCPSCTYKNNSKQEFVYHAFNFHPESIHKLKTINDDSISDVNCPWNDIEIKEEEILEQNNPLDDIYQNGDKIKEDPLYETENEYQNEKSTNKCYEQNDDVKENFHNGEMLDINKDHEEILDDFQDEDNGSIPIGVEEHKCNLCGKTFLGPWGKQYVKRHKFAVHDNIRGFKCVDCPKTYKNSYDLKMHRHRKHQCGPSKMDVYQKCEYCSKKYPKKYMSLHLKDHVTNRIKFQCQQCDKGYYHKTKLLHHISVAHEGKLLKCKECEKEYRSQKGLRQHMDSVHKNIQYICEFCGTILKTLDSYREHMAKHDGVNKFQCPKCTKVFVTSRTLGEHISNVHDEKKHVCSICGKAFAKSYRLLDHEKIKHKNERFQCQYCEKSYAQPKGLSCHIISAHEPHRKIPCDQCDKKFVEKQSLDAHKEYVHEGIQKFRCDQCSKSFSTKFKKLRHAQTVHEGRKDHKCNECNMAYGQSGDLKRHKIRAHINVKK